MPAEPTTWCSTSTAPKRLMPFVRAIVPTVDLSGGSVLIDAPDGLFEL